MCKELAEEEEDEVLPVKEEPEEEEERQDLATIPEEENEEADDTICALPTPGILPRRVVRKNIYIFFLQKFA